MNTHNKSRKDKKYLINWKRRLDYQYRKLDWFSKFVLNTTRISRGIGKYKVGYEELWQEYLKNEHTQG